MDCIIPSILEEYGINTNTLNTLSYNTGLIIRKREITTESILDASVLSSIQGNSSYNDLSSLMDNNSNISVSRQAVSKKINKNCRDFLQGLIGIVIKKRVSKPYSSKIINKLNYKRIIVQDSTIIKLPLSLFKLFSGVSNGHSKSTNVRVQVVYDLLSEQFIYFKIDSYSVNDLKAAPNF